jgi:hypothetical protein
MEYKEPPTRPDETELLIRSLTSILHLVKPQVVSPKSFDDSPNSAPPPLGRVLNNIAALFTIKDQSDVSAVAVKLAYNVVRLYQATQDSSDFEQEQSPRGSAPEQTLDEEPTEAWDHVAKKFHGRCNQML